MVIGDYINNIKCLFDNLLPKKEVNFYTKINLFSIMCVHNCIAVPKLLVFNFHRVPVMLKHFDRHLLLMSRQET